MAAFLLSLYAFVCVVRSLTVSKLAFDSSYCFYRSIATTLFFYQKAFGQLVSLGFAIADFTPATYQRHSL